MGEESLRYLIALYVLHALLLTVVVVARRDIGDIATATRSSGAIYLAGGLGSVCAYGSVLLAVRFAPLGYVAALRESSVILAALAGWYLLKESFGPHRTLGAVVVAAGIVLMLLP